MLVGVENGGAMMSATDEDDNDDAAALAVLCPLGINMAVVVAGVAAAPHVEVR